MREVRARKILSSHNVFNVYHGCTNRCLYCPNRSRLSGIKNFENTGVKRDAVELLDSALRAKRKKCMLRTGTYGDPYQPVEKNTGLFRESLELIKARGFGVSIITKSQGILRDLDLIQEINERSKAVVEISLSSVLEDRQKLLEPGAATTVERLEIIKRFRDLKIPVIVKIDPILPRINDNPRAFKALLEEAAALNPTGLYVRSFSIQVKNSTRGYLLERLEKKLPKIGRYYREKFGDRFIIESTRSTELQRVYKKCLSNAEFLTDIEEIRRFLRKYESRETGEQLSFFKN